MFNSFILTYLKEALIFFLFCILLGSKSDRKAKRGEREACNRQTIWIWTMQTKVTLAQLTQLYESHTPLNSLIVRYALFCLLLILMPSKSALVAYSFLTACLSIRPYPRIDTRWLPPKIVAYYFGPL